ncbi:MAG TPA: hypothetical protein VF412_12925 [Bdellovibrio sp.]|uniref:hypothetical protein n=1 Tax=Bdellovibrio sp. TaxID=28201 RepID=UPI002F1F76D2
MIRSILVFVVLLVSQLSLASGFGLKPDWKEVGNGGNVVHCGKGYRMLDAWEAENGFKLPESTVNFPETIFDDSFDAAFALANTLVDSLRYREFSRWQSYKEALATFKQEAEFLEHVNLLPVNDQGLTVIPINCSLEQLVVQRRDIAADNIRYVFSGQIWAHLTVSDKAAAIVHEVIYRRALNADPEILTSEDVRAFNGLLISNRVETMSNFEYYLMAEKVPY